MANTFADAVIKNAIDRIAVANFKKDPLFSAAQSFEMSIRSSRVPPSEKMMS